MFNTALIPHFFSTIIFGQNEWAPLGASWWHVEVDATGQHLLKYNCVDTATIQGKICKVIEQGSQTYYAYEENGKVYYYYYEPEETFALRYDFDREVGETWDCQDENTMLECTLNSVEDVEYGGQVFQLQIVEIKNPNTPNASNFDYIIKGIGSRFHFYMPNGPVQLSNWGLACYYSPEIGTFEIKSFPNVDCNEIVSTEHGFNEEYFEPIFPNPAKNIFYLKTEKILNGKNWELQILDSFGKVVKKINVPDSSELHEIKTEGLATGIYFIQLLENGLARQVQKLVVVD